MRHWMCIDRCKDGLPVMSSLYRAQSLPLPPLSPPPLSPHHHHCLHHRYLRHRCHLRLLHHRRLHTVATTAAAVHSPPVHTESMSTADTTAVAATITTSVSATANPTYRGCWSTSCHLRLRSTRQLLPMRADAERYQRGGCKNDSWDERGQRDAGRRRRGADGGGWNGLALAAVVRDIALVAERIAARLVLLIPRVD